MPTRTGSCYRIRTYVSILVVHLAAQQNIHSRWVEYTLYWRERERRSVERERESQNILYKRNLKHQFPGGFSYSKRKTKNNTREIQLASLLLCVCHFGIDSRQIIMHTQHVHVLVHICERAERSMFYFTLYDRLQLEHCCTHRLYL